MNFSSHATVIGEIHVIGLSGELDLSSLPRFSDSLNKAIQDSPSHLAFDLDGITVLDDAALGILLGVAARLRSQGGQVYIVSSHQKISDYLCRMGIDLIIPMHISVHDITK